MFDLFKEDAEASKDVKVTRDNILKFIKDELQASEGGEGRNIRGLQIYSACTNNNRQLYESALYFEDQERLKEEIQKIADDFALELPEYWTLELFFVDLLPEIATIFPSENIALLITTKQHLQQKAATGVINILNGEAEKSQYIINSGTESITIGRERSAQGSDGFFRINAIAFPGESTNEANKYISRQHAHISWNSETGNFMIFADDGGVPPHNKIKIKSLGSDRSLKLNSTQIGHVLNEGDQIILGESAVIEFRFMKED